MRIIYWKAITICGLIDKDASKPAKTQAIRILLAGPAHAMSPAPLLWFFKLLGLYGTGFAQPTITGCMPKRSGIESKSGRMTEPTGSIWLIGFIVRRPMR